MWIIFVAWAVLVAIIGTVLILVWRDRKKRKEEYQTYAQRHNFKFQEKPSLDILQGFTHRLLLRKEKSIGISAKKEYSNYIISGKKENYIWNIMEYCEEEWTGGSNASKRRTTSTIFIIETNKHLPTFSIEQSSAIKKVVSYFKSGYIEFPDDAEFTKQFLVDGNNIPAVQKYFTASIKDYFKAEQPEYIISTYQNKIAFFRWGKIVRVADLESQINEIKSILQKIVS